MIRRSNDTTAGPLFILIRTCGIAAHDCASKAAASP